MAGARAASQHRNGTVSGIELKSCTSVFNKEGRFQPAYDECKLTTIKAEQIIVAIGQMLDPMLVKNTGTEIERGCFKADAVTQETSLKGVFAGGDSVSGPASVIQAVSSASSF